MSDEVGYGTIAAGPRGNLVEWQSPSRFVPIQEAARIKICGSFLPKEISTEMRRGPRLGNHNLGIVFGVASYG